MCTIYTDLHKMLTRMTAKGYGIFLPRWYDSVRQICFYFNCIGYSRALCIVYCGEHWLNALNASQWIYTWLCICMIHMRSITMYMLKIQEIWRFCPNHFASRNWLHFQFLRYWMQSNVELLWIELDFTCLCWCALSLSHIFLFAML